MTHPDPQLPSREAPGGRHRPGSSQIGLPRARRSYALPILIALITFVIVISARLYWGGLERGHAMLPAQPETSSTPAAPSGN